MHVPHAQQAFHVYLWILLRVHRIRDHCRRTWLHWLRFRAFTTISDRMLFNTRKLYLLLRGTRYAAFGLCGSVPNVTAGLLFELWIFGLVGFRVIQYSRGGGRKPIIRLLFYDALAWFLL